MNIIKIIPFIKSFTPSNDKWAEPLIVGQKVEPKLIPKHLEHKYLFELFLNNYYTNINTDFILDISGSCLVQFDVDTLVPTLNDLYEAYKAANHKFNLEIVKHGNGIGIKTVDLNVDNVTLKYLEKGFNNAIEQMLMV
jgi:hypothetical protein